LAAGLLAAAAQAQPSPSPPTVIDGPSATITSLNGLSVARDGTGGVVYVKAAQVFVSALVGGQFQAPVEVDAGLPAGSSQPVIAAGNGGVLLIAFVNAAQLYVVQRASATAAYSAPAALAGAAASPSLQVSNLGKAYLAFTVADGAGHDVRAAYWAGGSWSLEPTPLNAVAPGDDAGTGTGAPAVATAGDGVAIVAWGEEGHIYTRRVWGTAPSVVDEQADVASVAGCGEVSVGDPAVAAGGDSSYADVAFREVVSCAGGQQARVLVNRLRGSQFDGAVAADGLAAGADSAGDPAVAMTEYGQGLVTSEDESAHGIFGMELGNNGAPGGVLGLDSAQGTSPPDPVPAIAGLFSDLVAWQQDPGTAGPAEIRVRYEPRASTLGPELVVSNPAQGATDAARGLAAWGDVGGDAAIAWVQGSGTSTEIVVERLYQPPGAAPPTNSSAYVRTTQPVLSWTPSGARWGPIAYTVSVDRTLIGQTGASSIRVPSPLPDGSHTWSVSAGNPAGLSSAARTARLFVDTVAPRLGTALSGARHTGSKLTLRLTYRDAPPAGLPARDASGVASLTIHWGDGTTTHVNPGTRRITHSYRRPGRYKITVAVLDRAGNRTTAVRRVKITNPPAKPKSPKGRK
jgi:PKD domain